MDIENLCASYYLHTLLFVNGKCSSTGIEGYAIKFKYHLAVIISDEGQEIELIEYEMRNQHAADKYCPSRTC